MGVIVSLYIVVFIYVAAMVAANLSVSFFGPSVSPINSFLLIGLDLTLRDLLHVRLKRGEMLLLIVSAGGITYALNPSAGVVAVASSTAFVAAALVDWWAFTKTTGGWFRKSNVSNTAAAAVDSIVFPLIAFGGFLPHIVIAQFTAKVAGGFMWAWIITRTKIEVPKCSDT